MNLAAFDQMEGCNEASSLGIHDGEGVDFERVDSSYGRWLWEMVRSEVKGAAVVDSDFTVLWITTSSSLSGCSSSSS